MEQKDIEYFRTLLNNMLEEAQHKGDSTLEDLTDSNELFADPADRASAESDRAFTLRIRDRERRLIRKIQAAIQRLDEGTYGICEDCGEDISIPRLKARPVTKLCTTARPVRKKGKTFGASNSTARQGSRFGGLFLIGGPARLPNSRGFAWTAMCSVACATSLRLRSWVAGSKKSTARPRM